MRTTRGGYLLGLAALDHARKIFRTAERIFFSIATTVNAVVDSLFFCRIRFQFSYFVVTQHANSLNVFVRGSTPTRTCRAPSRMAMTELCNLSPVRTKFYKKVGRSA